MAISIRTNYSSLDAQRNLSQSQGALDSSMRKLSSGYRITRGADDAAGLAISEKLSAKISGTNQAIRNANDGISLIQTAEGGLSEVGNIIQRVRELAVQGSNGTLAATDRTAISKEMAALNSEITSIATRTTFNGISLIGTGAASVNLQVGADNGQTMSVALSDLAGVSAMMSFSAVIGSFFAAVSGASAGTAATTGQAAAQSLISKADSALTYINGKRADLGANQNRLEHAVAVQQVASENLSNAQSRIRDVDVAAETAQMTKTNILMQAGVSVLAQANQQPQMALKLLGG
jgi:flagellin